MGWVSDSEATTRPLCELGAMSPPQSVTVPLSSANAETLPLLQFQHATLNYHLEPCRHNRPNGDSAGSNMSFSDYLLACFWLHRAGVNTMLSQTTYQYTGCPLQMPKDWFTNLQLWTCRHHEPAVINLEEQQSAPTLSVCHRVRVEVCH